MAVLFGAAGLLVLCLLAAVHWYMWRRLVRDVSAPRGVWRRAGTVLFVVLPLLTVGALASGHGNAPFTLERVLAWPGFLWLALILYLMLALLAGELVRAVLRRTPPGRRAVAAARGAVAEEAPAQDGTAQGGPAQDGTAQGGTSGGAPAVPYASRRVFLARSLAAGAALAGGGTVAAGAYGVFNGPTLKHVTVPLAKLPRSADGYRIAVVSDIHLGPILGRAHTERVVHTINSAQPDLVAVVGDLVDGSVADLGRAAEPLRDLRARHGAYFVTGNHEYFGNADEWIAYVREHGVHPLVNERRELPGFDLAGVNDINGSKVHEGPDYARALGDRDTSRASVLLAHQPVTIHTSVDYGVDLQLSGHTHGGQLWPGNYVAALANPTVAGLDRYGDTQLYVTRGAGAWGPPVRVGAESDVTVVRLASRQA